MPYWFSLLQCWLLQLHLCMALLYSYSFKHTGHLQLEGDVDLKGRVWGDSDGVWGVK